MFCFLKLECIDEKRGTSYCSSLKLFLLLLQQLGSEHMLVYLPVRIAQLVNFTSHIHAGKWILAIFFGFCAQRPLMVINT